MRECPAIIAALPREVNSLVRGWQEHKLLGKIVAYTSDNAVVACAGMGPERAILAAQAAISLKPVTMLLSVGLAGACDPALNAGTIVRAGVVVDTKTGERYDNSQFKHVLVSTPTIAGVEEKRRLREAYGASAVDMEAAAVARIAQARGLSFQAIKAISDEADFEMLDLARFATPDGQFREKAFAIYAAIRLPLWRDLVLLGKNSKRAIAALTTELEVQLSWYRQRG